MARVKDALVRGVSRRTIIDAMHKVKHTGTPFFGECDVMIDGQVYAFQVSLNAHDDGQILGVAISLGERIPNETAIRSLSLELAHRTKNLMAVISSLAQQTGRRSNDIIEFNGSFMQQLGALSRAHDAIATTGWRGALLETVIAGSNRSVSQGAKVVVDGETSGIMLTPNAAQNVALLLHELAACSDSRSTIRILSECNHDGPLRLTWDMDRMRGDKKIWADFLTKIAPLSLDGKGELSGGNDEPLTYTLTISTDHFASV